MSDEFPKDCCERCRFWKYLANNMGHCHRRAPVAMSYSVIPGYLADIGHKICGGPTMDTTWDEHDRASLDYTSWPGTDADEWCGDFEVKV